MPVPETVAVQESAAALVRAIRRVMRHPAEGDNINGGLEAVHGA